MRSMEELERNQMNGDSNVLAQNLSVLESTANESEFVKLSEMLAYLKTWQRIFAQRKAQLEENLVAAFVEDKSSELRLGVKADAKQGAQFKADKENPTLNLEKSAQVNAEAGYQRGTSNKQNINALVKSSGSNGDAVTREQKARCHKELMAAFRRLGFRRLIAAEEMLGKWLWRWSTGAGLATVSFDLKPSGEMVAELIPDNPKDWPYNAFVRTGKGTWQVLDGKLTIHMEKVIFLWNPVDFIADREVASINARRVTLAGPVDNVLERPPTRGSSGTKK